MFGWFKKLGKPPQMPDLPSQYSSAPPDAGAAEKGRIHVTCGRCGVRMTVPKSCQGNQGVCFGCGAEVTVPRDEAVAQKRKNMLFDAGERIADRYVIEKSVGKGGMGVVYKAMDTLIKEPVALKFMIPEYLESREGQRLFIEEAQMARRLRHKNIVATHDVSWTGENILYLSMEFMQGQSLRQYLRRKREQQQHIRVKLTVEIVAQTLEALQYAHRIVVHRDLKPENIMLLPGEVVKVLDFGLAKAAQEAAIETEAAGGKQARRLVGTLAYAAPEQKKGVNIDLRADLYTVGLVFHELLTLRTPIDKPVKVPDVRDDVSPALLAVLDKSLEEDRDQRWQSAGDMRAALLSAFEESYSRVTVKKAVTASGREVSTEGMAFIDGGSFLMGNNDVRKEAPEFEAEVGPFYMDRTPVTNGQYRKYIEATGAPEPKFWRDPNYNGDDQPVVGVSWQEASAFAEWTGKKLPTEAQWEMAARGKENRKYPWGNMPPQSTICNSGDYLGMPSVVRMHEASQTPEGILDLAGNVYEWTLDPYVPYVADLHGRAPETDEPRRAVRGGSWHSPPHELTTSHRTGLFPESQLDTVGFRCVLPVGSGQKV